MFGSLGWPEILVILVVALIIFGPRKLPELGKTLGQSLAQFRKASEDFKRTWEDEVEVERRKLDTYHAPAYDPKPEVTTAPVESPPGGQVTEAAGGASWEGVTNPTATAEHQVATTAPLAETGHPAGEPVAKETRRDWM